MLIVVNFRFAIVYCAIHDVSIYIGYKFSSFEFIDINYTLSQILLTQSQPIFNTRFFLPYNIVNSSATWQPYFLKVHHAFIYLKIRYILEQNFVFPLSSLQLWFLYTLHSLRFMTRVKIILEIIQLSKPWCSRKLAPQQQKLFHVDLWQVYKFNFVSENIKKASLMLRIHFLVDLPITNIIWFRLWIQVLAFNLFIFDCFDYMKPIIDVISISRNWPCA